MRRIHPGLDLEHHSAERIVDLAREHSLLILADVSLSVRTTTRFTLQLVHGLQSMVAHVRSFAFVSDLVEITDLFAGFDLVEPGLVYLPLWHPDSPDDVDEHPERANIYAGVGLRADVVE